MATPPRMSDHLKALLLSFSRVLLGCLVTAYTAVAGSQLPFSLTTDDWQKIGNAVWGAVLVTAFNYLRSGETRFGRNAADMGMGGEDTLDPPDGRIQVAGNTPAVAPVPDIKPPGIPASEFPPATADLTFIDTGAPE